MFTWRWANDKWLSKEESSLPRFLRGTICSYDKLQHLVGGFILALFNPYIAFAFWFMWEVKDAIIPCEMKYIMFGYNWGGDGFSIKDLIAATAGIVIALIIKGA